MVRVNRIRLAVSVLLLLTLAGCGGGQQKTSGEREVKASEFADWPLTVPGGRLQCQMTQGGEAVQIYVPPYAYALNGTAKSFLRASDLKSIWADQPDGTG